MARAPESNTGRRQFIGAVARGAAACALTAATAVLIGKHGLDGLSCVNRGSCRDCSILRSCSLPAARQSQQAIEEPR